MFAIQQKNRNMVCSKTVFEPSVYTKMQPITYQQFYMIRQAVYKVCPETQTHMRTNRQEVKTEDLKNLSNDNLYLQIVKFDRRVC